MKFRHLVFLLSIIFLAACTRIEEQTSKIYVNLGETIQSVDAHTGEITLLEFNGSQITVSSSGSQFAYYTQELTSTHILVNDGINTEEVAELPFGYSVIITGLTWSYDDQHIAFLATFSAEDLNRSQLVVVDINSGDWRFITGPVNSYSWNPQAMEIAAFPAGVDSGIGLYLIDYTGETWRRLLQNTFVGGIEWSPDGDQLAIITSDGNLVIIDIASREQRTVYDDGFLSLMRWSPDGQSMLIQDSSEQLFVIDLNDESLRVINEYAPRSNAVWSPDGCCIAYLQYDQELWESDLVIFDVGTSSSEVLMSGIISANALVWR